MSQWKMSAFDKTSPYKLFEPPGLVWAIVVMVVLMERATLVFLRGYKDT